MSGQLDILLGKEEGGGVGGEVKKKTMKDCHGEEIETFEVTKC